MADAEEQGRSPAAEAALFVEMDGVKALLTRATADIAHGEGNLHVLLALLSPGMERLLRTVLGVMAEAEQRPWPADMNALGLKHHDIAGLHRLCLQGFHARADQAQFPARFRAELERVEEDEEVSQLLDLVTAYARGGRFWYQDTLARRPPAVDKDPLAAVATLIKGWVTAAAPSTPALTGDDWLEQARAVNNLILRVLRSWFSLYFKAWAFGPCGPVASRKQGMLLIPGLI